MKITVEGPLETDAEVLGQLIKVLTQNELPKTLCLEINSAGGNALYGIACYGMIRSIVARGIPVTAHIVRAESAAALLALACDTRTIKPDGALTIHMGQVTIRANEAASGEYAKQLVALTSLSNIQTDIIKSRLPKEAVQMVLSKCTTTNHCQMDAGMCTKFGIATVAETCEE